MKKISIILTLILFNLYGYSQQPDSPYCALASLAVQGSNSFVARSGVPVYYTYSLEEGEKLYFFSSNQGATHISSSFDCNQGENFTYGQPNNFFTASSFTGHILIFIYPDETGLFEFEIVVDSLDNGDNCDLAFTAVSGVNNFEATAQNHFWFSYDLPAGKKIKYTSDNSAEVEIMSGTCADLTNIVIGQNEASFAKLNEGGKVYFRITPQLTETFGFSIQEIDIDEGDNCENAVEVTSGEYNFSAIQNQPYWVKFNLSSNKKLSFNSTMSAGVEISTGVYCGGRSLHTYAYGYPNLEFSEVSTGGDIYIQISPYQSGEFQFELAELDLSNGDNCEVAIDANLGINSFESKRYTPKWYSYNLSPGKKLDFNSQNSAGVEFSEGSDCSNRSNFNSGYPNIEYFSSNDGGQVFFQVYPYQDGQVEFDLNEADIIDGDLCDAAMIAAQGLNTFEVAAHRSFWLQYDLPTRKKLSVSSADVSSIEVSTGPDCQNLTNYQYGSSNVDYSDLPEGGTVYIEVNSYNSGLVDLNIEEIDIPETECSGAVDANIGQNTFEGVAGQFKWFKYIISEGKKLDITSDNLGEISVYSAANCSEVGNSYVGYPNFTYSGNYDVEPVYIRVNPDENADFVFNLNEVDFEEGEVCQFAAIASEGLNVANKINYVSGSVLWYKYQTSNVGDEISISSPQIGRVVLYSGKSCQTMTFIKTGSSDLNYTTISANETLFFVVEFYNSDTFEFDFTVNETSVGENCTLAINASEGLNSFTANAKNPKWFKYELPTGKKLLYEGDLNGRVVIGTGQSCNELTSKLYSFNVARYSKLDNGGTVYIKIIPENSGDFEFVITIEDISEGDKCNLSTQAVEGLNSFFGYRNNDYWFTYNLPAGKKLIVDSDQFVNWDLYAGDDCDNKIFMTYGAFNTSLKNIWGESLIYLKGTPQNIEEINFQVTIEDLNPGESCATAIDAQLEGNYSSTVPQWYKFQAPTSSLYTISSVGLTNSDTRLFIYENCNTDPIAINNDYSYSQSQVSLSLVEGDIIYIYWDDYFSSEAFNWSITSEPNLFEKIDQTIVFNSLATKTFGDPNYELSASASSGLAVNYESSNPNVATVSGSIISILNAGTTTITASQDGDGTYNPANSVSQELVVAKVDQTITFDALAAKTFGADNFDLTASTDATGLTVSYESSNTSVATVSGSTVTIVGAGSTTITVSQEGDGTYNPATPVEQTLTVNKANQTITVEDIADKEVTATPFDVTATTNSGLALTYEVTGPATISGKTITMEGIEGTVTVTVSQAGNANYNSAEQEVNFELINSKSDQTITISPIADKFTTDASFDVEASTNSGLELSYEIIDGPASIEGKTITLGGFEGTVELVVSQPGNADFNPATASISFAVTEDPCFSFEILGLATNVSCAGANDGSFTLDARDGKAPYKFSVDDGEFVENNVFTGLSAGEYSISVIDANGCTSSAFIEITSPDAMEVTAEVANSTSILGNGSIFLMVTGGMGEYTYSWSNQATTAFIEELEVGEYTVTVTDETGCSIEESYTVGGVTANKDVLSNSLSIYPNPVQDVVTLQHSENATGLKLYDARGKVIRELQVKGQETELNMSALPAGMYFLRSDQDTKLFRFVKQ